MLIKKFIFIFFITIFLSSANACIDGDEENCEKIIQFTMHDNIFISNIIYRKNMFGKYVLNLRYYQAIDKEGNAYMLTEDQLIDAIEFSIGQVNKNKLDSIQLRWDDSESLRKSIELSLKENTSPNGSYSAQDSNMKRITTRYFVQSSFIQKICFQLENLDLSCNFETYILEPLMFKTGLYSSGKVIQSDENANIDWIGSASYQLWFNIPINLHRKN